MSRISRIGIVVSFAAVLAGCEAQCSVSSASLSEETMTNAVNAETKAPAAAVTSFQPDAPAIYATAKLSHAPSGTKVKATFHYLEGGDRQIAEDEVTAEGTRYVSFTLSPPNRGWPAGQYETRLLLNGKETKRLPFNVGGGGAAPVQPPPVQPPPVQISPDPVPPPQNNPGPGAAPSVPAATQTKWFRDDAFGVAVQLPVSWTYRLTPQKSYLFEGPKGTDAFELGIILQFVSKSMAPGSSAAAQLKSLEQGLTGTPGAVIRTRDTVTVAGVVAPFFGATYSTKDSSGRVVPFAHTQLVVDHGAYYYIISYSGPTEIYQKYLPDFQRLIETFTLK